MSLTNYSHCFVAHITCSEESEDERLQEAAVDPHTLVPIYHKIADSKD